MDRETRHAAVHGVAKSQTRLRDWTELTDNCFPGGSDSKESAYNAGDRSLILGQKDPLEKEMATHSSILT